MVQFNVNREKTMPSAEAEPEKLKNHVQVVVALDGDRVSLIGGLAVHPSNEHQEWQRWCVTAPCGLAVGKFATREAAESYANAISKLADWGASPRDVMAAAKWSREFFSGDKRKAIQAARDEADALDAKLEHRAAVEAWDETPGVPR